MFIEYRGKAPRVAATAFVAPTAVLVGDVVVDDESSIWFGVVIRADRGTVRIGARSAIEDNAVIHATDDRTTIVGNDVTIGHCAVLDDCTIEDGALVGSNAVVLGGAIVGQRTVIAAGAIVAAEAHIPASVVAAGAPAKVHKAVTGRAQTWIAQSTSASLEQARAYRRDNIGDPQHHEVKTTSRRKRGAVLV